MKTNIKILDQEDPEFVNASLDKKSLDEISVQLGKRRFSPVKSIKQAIKQKVDGQVKN
ncbi:hypothetical protein L0657_12255 [Dyadobacter sp. CY345]|uniref:hypothetical protein n=1 Tax=Dyadobacter sp. CY345 TaxID=2909335 RepID=UPI001F2AFCE8|nr:hypothetical protein [Dyadobacter sp. CY345]MCF2444732.1 hypothetical protein [Dyadobacter sp. CY345]